MKIRIRFDKFEVEGNLDDTNVVKDLAKLLPIEGKANLWGGEIYVELQEMLPYPGDKDEVEIGDTEYQFLRFDDILAVINK